MWPLPACRRLPALSALLLAPLAVCAETQAAVTIGSSLSAAPTSACTSPTGCTATTLSSVSRPVAAPSNGVVVRFRIKHGPAPPGTGFKFKILTPVSSDPVSFVLAWQSPQIPFGDYTTGGTDLMQPLDARNRPAGVAISAGQRIAASAPGGVGFQGSVPGSAVGEHDGDHASGSAGYSTHGGHEALINADVEPDADRDGYGDESQDNCPTLANDQSTNPCPATPPAETRPSDYVEPRIGRLTSRRRSLSSLSRRGLGVAVACAGPCSARGRLVMRTRAGRAVTVGGGRRRSASGASFRLKLKLTRTGRRLLRRSRRATSLSVRISASDARSTSSRRQRLVVTPR